MKRTGVLLLLFLFATSACSSKSAPAAVAVPGTDEAAMVNRVLTGLDGVIGDLQRTLVRDRRMTTDITDRLKALYTGPELLNQIDAFRADVTGGMVGYRNPPGNRVTTVRRLITASPICIFAEVTRDYAPVTDGPAPPPSALYVVLVTKTAADDPKALNPTPWAMLYDGVQADNSQPEDVCR